MTSLLSTILPGATPPIATIESDLKSKQGYICLGGFDSDFEGINLVTKLHTLIWRNHERQNEPLFCRIVHTTTLEISPEARSLKSLAKSVLLQVTNKPNQLDWIVAFCINTLVFKIAKNLLEGVPDPTIRRLRFIPLSIVILSFCIEIFRIADQCFKAYKVAKEASQKTLATYAHVEYIPAPGPAYDQLLNERSPDGLFLEPVTRQPIPFKDFYSPRLIVISGYAFHITNVDKVIQTFQNYLYFEPANEFLSPENAVDLVTQLSIYFCITPTAVLEKFTPLEIPENGLINLPQFPDAAPAA